jgi:catechol 2,3-dioxygenase-like lactoylglutathione lyase family enzyme
VSDYAIEGIDHVFFCTQGWDRTMGFWRDALGLEVQQDWSHGDYHGAALTLGDARVTLADAEEERDGEVGFRVEPGRPHLYLKVRGLDALTEALKAKGYEHLSGPVAMHWGPQVSAFRDPEGVPVMFVEWPQA